MFDTAPIAATDTAAAGRIVPQGHLQRAVQIRKTTIGVNQK